MEPNSRPEELHSGDAPPSVDAELAPDAWDLETLLNVPVLQSLMEDHAKLTQMVTAILDLEGKVLVAAGWQDICTGFHRVHPESLRNCTESDLYLAGQVKRGEYVAYRCMNGLWDVVTPLYVADRHMGNIYTGQFFYDDEVIDRQAFEAQADRFGFDRTAYLEALDRVPRFSRDQVKRLMDFLVKLTDFVSSFTLGNLRSTAYIREQSRVSQALRRSETALRENQSMLALILDTIPQSVFWKGLDGRYLGCNMAFSRAAGLAEPSEVIGKTDFDLPWTREEAEAYRADDREVIHGGKPKFHILETLHQSDGTDLLADTSKVPLLDGRGAPFGILGIYEDVTARRKAEVEVVRLADLLQASQTLAKVGGWEIDLVANTLYWTDETYRIHDTSPEEYTPTIESAIAFYAPESLPVIQEAVTRLIEDGTPFDLELEVITAKGRRIAVHTTSRSVQENGRTVKVLGAFRDITEQRKAERENRELMARISQSQKMESLGSLAGGVAHDMNNVLGAILGLATAHIDAHPVGSPTRKAFETIIKATQRGGQMVSSLLGFARQTAAEHRQVDMNAILREEVGLLEHTTLARVQLDLDLAEDLCPIRGDAGALAHAVMNLCVNAVDAMAEGGTLTLRTRNVDREWIELSVSDTGTGMTREVLERAMDPFFTTKGQGKGTGLGLSIVYSTVKAHQGRIEIQSEPGSGTCVTLRFPACQAKPLPQVPSSDAGSLSEPSGKTVLVIDDDELILGSMEAVLEALGHRIALARSGEEALELLEGGLKPDLVILDMNMPGLGGAGTLPRLRARRADLPVLLITGKADREALDLIHAHPGTLLLPKPFSLQDLQAKLQVLM